MDERAEEIARMLGGIEVTGKAREHAREMLQMAGSPDQKARGGKAQGLNGRRRALSCSCWASGGPLADGHRGLRQWPYKRHRMVAKLIPQPRRDLFLALFDRLVHELFDAAAVQTHDMVVMRSLVELEHGHAVFEMVPATRVPRPGTA